MHVIVWEYRVREEARQAFEQAYGPHGTWVALFRRAAGYSGTELLRDESDPGRYWTIDRWDTHAAFAAFQRDHGAAYSELDRALEGLCSEERQLGTFEGISSDIRKVDSLAFHRQDLTREQHATPAPNQG